jgi:hypothetical protein
VGAKFQLGIPGRGLPPKRNLTPLLVSISVPMNHTKVSDTTSYTILIHSALINTVLIYNTVICTTRR